MQQAKTANLGPAALSTTAAAPWANIWVLQQIWVLRRFESASWTPLHRQIWLQHLIWLRRLRRLIWLRRLCRLIWLLQLHRRIWLRRFHWLPRLDRQTWLLRLDKQIRLHWRSQLHLQMQLGLIGKCGTCGLLVGKFDSAGKFGSVGNSLAIRLQRRLRWQFGSVGGSVCKFGSVGNSAASAIRLRWRLRLQIWIRRQVPLRWQFISNFAPPAAPSAALSANLDPSALWLHGQFGSVGSIGKFGSVGTSLRIWLHRQFGCIGKFVRR
jgi:hypothetical protein